MAKYKTVKVEIPELEQLPQLPVVARAMLDDLCIQYRNKQAEIEPLAKEAKEIKDKIDPLADELMGLGLPTRTLGESWDLRRTERQSEKINRDRLKSWLLKLGLKLTVPCPKTQTAEDGAISVCEFCEGTGTQVLEGLKAALWLLEEVTDRSESVSWSVYGRDKEKEKEKK